MIKKKKLTAIIPARIGSKGVPKKNIKKLGNVPLIAWTIKAALESNLIDEILVSTDSTEIAEIAKYCGASVPYIRSKNLATDAATSIAVIRDAIYKEKIDGWVMMLQCTSPFRSSEHIDDMINLMIRNNFNSAVSVRKTKDIPSWTYYIDNKTIKPVIKNKSKYRQEEKVSYTLNGAQYLANTNQLLKEEFINKNTMLYEMNDLDSLDIDTIHDWNYAEYLVKSKKKKY